MGHVLHKRGKRGGMRDAIRAALDGEELTASAIAAKLGFPHMPTLYANLTWMYWKNMLERSGERRFYRYRIAESEAPAAGIALLEAAFGITSPTRSHGQGRKL